MSDLRWRRHVVSFALLSALVSCTEPAAPAPSIPLFVIRSADWFAYRNDGGAWTRLTRGPSGRFEFVATPTVAIAYALTLPGSGPSLTIEYQTAEALRLEPTQTGRAPATYTGTARGVARGIPAVRSVAWIGHGPNSSNAEFASATDSAFSLLTWAVPMDLVATTLRFADSTRDISTGMRAIVRRGQTLPPGSAVTLDFAGAEAFPLDSATLAWTGPELGLEVMFISATGSRALLTRVQEILSDRAPRARTRVVSRMPPSRLVPGDLYQLLVGDGTREVTRWTRSLSDTVLGPWTVPAAPTVTLASRGASGRPQFTVPAHPDFGDEVRAVALQQGVVSGTPSYLITLHRVTVLMTRGYVGGTPAASWTLEVPDLTRLPGFPAGMLLAPGAYSWTVSAAGGNCLSCADSVFDGRVERRWAVGDTVR